MITEQTTSDAYQTMLEWVFHDPQFESSPRGMKTREILNFAIEIRKPSSDPIVTGDESRNKIIANYTAKEFEWYLSGCRKAVTAPAKFWQTIADEDGNVNSNYGHLVLKDESENGKTPFQWALDCLLADKDSRKAVVRYNKSKHCIGESKDFVCTLSQTFHIRDNKLYSGVVMRSSDLFTGIPYDLPWFSYIQEKMLNCLKMKYEKLEMGSMHFHTHSLHMYERNAEAIERMIKL